MQEAADTCWNEDDVLLPDETGIEKWDVHLDSLLDTLLSGREFELASGLLDEKPDTAAAVRSMPDVTDPCFSVPAPDILCSDERKCIASELRSLLSPHLTPGK